MIDHPEYTSFLSASGPRGQGNLRNVVTTLLIFFVVLTTAHPGVAGESNFVAQLGLTSFKPKSVAYHPLSENLLMVLNESGRIDILDISDPSRPVKKVEILGRATSAVFSPDGAYIVSGDWEGWLRFWDAVSGTPVAEPLKGHKDRVVSIAFGHDPFRLLSVGADDTLRVWNAVDAEPTEGQRDWVKRELVKGRTDWHWVKNVAFNRDRTSLVSISNFGVFRFSDLQKAEPLSEPTESKAKARSAGFSPDGNRFVLGDKDGNLSFWEVDRGTRVGDPLEGHKGSVESVAFSRDGIYLVSGDSNGMLRLWTASSGKPYSELIYGHKDTVNSLAFNQDGTRLVSGSRDGTLRIWDVGSMKPVGEPIGVSKVSHLEFSSNGTRLVSIGSDNTLRFWDAKTGNPREPIREHGDGVRSFAFNRDGTRFVSVGWDRTLHFLDVDSGEPLGERLEREKVQALSAAFSPDGTHIVSGNAGGRLLFWNAENGKLDKVVNGLNDEVRSVAFSPDGTRLVAAGGDGTLGFWDTKSRTPLYPPVKGHENLVERVMFSPNGTRLVYLDFYRTLQFWNVKNGEPIGDAHKDHKEAGSIRFLAFSPDDTRLVSVDSGGTVILWDAENGKLLAKPLEAHNRVVQSAAFSRDGTRLVSVDSDSTVFLWNAKNGKPLPKPLKVHNLEVWSAAFSRDGTRLVTGGRDGTLRYWDVDSGKPFSDPIAGYQRAVQTIRFNPDGTRLVSVGSDSSDGSDYTVRFWQARSIESLGNPIKGREDQVQSVAINRDGTRLVYADPDNTLRLWDLRRGHAVGNPLNRHGTTVKSVAFNRSGNRFVSRDVDNVVFLWNGETGEFLGELFTGLRVQSVAFHPDGEHIAAGDVYGTLHLWDVKNQVLVTRFSPEGSSTVTSVAFNRTGTRLVSQHYDESVRVWNGETGEFLGELFTGLRVKSVAFHPDEKHIAAGDAHGTLHLWDLGDRKPVDSFSLKGHRRTVTSVAFNRAGTRLVSGDSHGKLFLWDVEGRSNLAVKQVCAEIRGLYLFKPAVIATHCPDRHIFFSSTLEKQGSMFLSKDGLVATAVGRGVYASPQSLKGRVLAFRATENRGGAPTIPIDTIHEVLFDKKDLWIHFKIAAAWACRQLREARAFLRWWAWPVCGILLWVSVILVLGGFWIFSPARLVWWSMPRVGQVPSPYPPYHYGPVVWNVFLGILFLKWLGGTRRALENWLTTNRRVLEDECFTNREPVRERWRYLPIGLEESTSWFEDRVANNGRGLLWVHGPGGSGKSALSMYIVRQTLVSTPNAPVPILINEDWHQSLAAQIAEQLRHPTWTKGPTETMIETLGSHGLICPLIDSLSERGSDDAERSVSDAVSAGVFRHLVVTSRAAPSERQIWQHAKKITPQSLTRDHLPTFIETYAGAANAEMVHAKLTPFLAANVPSPLFLRFAIEQAQQGDLRTADRLSLVQQYVTALCSKGGDLISSDMLRAASVAAIVSIHGSLIPREFSEPEVLSALTVESHTRTFTNAAATNETNVARIPSMLEESGLLNRGTATLQFAYDPVAEYLAAWWTRELEKSEGRVKELDAFRQRIKASPKTGVGRAYLEITSSVS